jgi:hypothetical protein
VSTFPTPGFSSGPAAVAPSDGNVWTYNSAKSEWEAARITKLPGLPTADPHVADALWNNAGVLTVSAG